MTDTELVKAEMERLAAQQDALMNNPRIKKYINAVNEWVKSTKNRDMTDMTIYEKRAVAQCLYNAIVDTGMKAGTRLFEATTEDSISFLGIQLPVIAALLPSLALNELAVVQPLDRRIGAVFYLDVNYGSSKGLVSSGDTMISAKTGHAVGKSSRRYAMARVVDELLGTGNGTHSGTLSYAPGLINRENIVVYTLSNAGTTSESRTTLGTSDSSGNVTGDYVSSGTVNADGTYSITITGVDSSDSIYIQYDYQYDLPEDSYGNKTGVPEVDVAVTQASLEAIDFPLRAKYSIGAQIDLQKAHGINLESELVKYLGNEVKFTIDQVGLDMIDEAAASDDASWSSISATRSSSRLIRSVWT